MASINKVILVGNAGKDPIIRTVGASGEKVANFSIATSEKFKTKDGREVENTAWHSLVAWKGAAGVVEKYVKKGSPLYIEGRLKYSTYEDKDGIKKNKTEIIVDTLTLLGSKSNNDSNFTPIEKEDVAPEQNIGNTTVSTPESDLPF